MDATVSLLHELLREESKFMHAARWKSFWATIDALLMGGQLWLTALGRARAGKGAAAKHAIKAVDRLLGNCILFVERQNVYAALIRILLVRCPRPVLLVDTCEAQVGKFVLTASVAWDGRSCPIFSCVVPQVKPKQRDLIRFLEQLARVLPYGCEPIIVADAGFESGWFDAIEAMGWDYVGRIRNRARFLVDSRWVSLSTLQKRARSRPRSLQAFYPKTFPRKRRIVLSQRRKSSHRQHLTKRGVPYQRKDDKRYRKGAKEPWVLATSLKCNAAAVVNIYATRMQIEENYKDAKNHRWGWSLRHSKSRSDSRLEILMLICTIASFVQQTVGCAAEQLKLHHKYQANTVRDRRVLSLFYLGGLVMHTLDLELINKKVLRGVIARVRAKIRSHAEAAT